MLKKVIRLIKHNLSRLPGYSRFRKRAYVKYLNSIRADEHGQVTFISKIVNSLKDDSLILNCLDQLNISRRELDEKYGEAIKKAATLYKTTGNSFLKKDIYGKVLEGLRIDEYTEPIVRECTANNWPLKQAQSFRICLNMRSRKNQLGDFGVEWVLNHKINAYKFVDFLGVKRPGLFGRDYVYSNLPKRAGITIKPLQAASAQGVFLVFDLQNILDLKNKKQLNSWEELTRSLKHALSSGNVKENKWIVEELILADTGDKKILPTDLKFYCFYGKVALIVEICRYPREMFCYWAPSGEAVDTGKFVDKHFTGAGISQDQIDLAAYISGEIPAPFIRIDFLKTEQGLVFGEFTPRPGQYHELNNFWDKHLGDLFLDAEGRLVNDLLQGKAFDAYFNCVDSFE